MGALLALTVAPSTRRGPTGGPLSLESGGDSVDFPKNEEFLLPSVGLPPPCPDVVLLPLPVRLLRHTCQSPVHPSAGTAGGRLR